MRILAAEPYAAPSHRVFLEGLAANSQHDIQLALLPARTWKWRMRTASFHYARLIENDGPWDLLFASDYLNLAETLALLPPAMRRLPAVIYFHENQLTYPLREGEERDIQFAMTHIHSILSARHTLFNSNYHRESFADAVQLLMAKAPDIDLTELAPAIRERSSVLPLGLDLPAGSPAGPSESPVILWPHRWEYDKDPAAFLAALIELERMELPFRLRLAGQRFRDRPPELAEIESRFADRLQPDGFLQRDQYLRSLRQSHIVVSTALHEFFGLGTLEAVRTGAFPVLPRDLAYPELLPEVERTGTRFFYERADTATDCLARALEAVRNGELIEPRADAIRFTDQFVWDRLGPRFDKIFELAAE